MSDASKRSQSSRWRSASGNSRAMGVRLLLLMKVRSWTSSIALSPKTSRLVVKQRDTPLTASDAVRHTPSSSLRGGLETGAWCRRSGGGVWTGSSGEPDLRSPVELPIPRTPRLSGADMSEDIRREARCPPIGCVNRDVKLRSDFTCPKVSACHALRRAFAWRRPRAVPRSLIHSTGRSPSARQSSPSTINARRLVPY